MCVRDVYIYVICGVYLVQDNCNTLFGKENLFCFCFGNFFFSFGEPRHMDKSCLLSVSNRFNGAELII